MAPPTASDPQQLTAEVQTEAEEVKADIAETKAAIADAKQDGDTDRVDRLEETLKAQDAKLDKVIEALDKIASRPFHPAPDLAPAPPETAPAPPEAAPPAAEDKPAKPKGRKPSRAFFGARADDDD